MTTPSRDVIRADRSSAANILDELSLLGWRVFDIEGGHTVQSFFQSAKHNLPMDPPISGSVNWDALSDSIFGGVDALSTKHVAVVWRDADGLLRYDPESFSTAQSVLADVADYLRRDRKALGTEAGLRSFLLGEGTEFPPLDPADLRPDEE